jgi:hypothetical protein
MASERLSSCPPKLEVVLVSLATRPSSTSAIIAKKMRKPASAKEDKYDLRIKEKLQPIAGLRLAKTIAKNPQAPFIRVIKDGSTAMYFRRFFLRPAAFIWSFALSERFRTLNGRIFL